MPLALAPTPAKPAKITPAICYTAACKAKQRKSAKAYAIAEGLRRSKRTTSGDTGRNTTDSGLTANKDDNNTYNRAYVLPANTEEEKGGSGDNDSVNSSTSNGTDKGKDGGICERSEGALHCEDTLLYKR
ncbi:hypothetical protein P8C59_003070 [Phyllachora maydis]|uniref:Uncharacterized protein n=1 Tax=Phyllachora maydis TaxID=1825666 RepID=A0AAD9HZJ2_9PEZI|nr:hypothetical protein P8C59_003070 [Phyllachora maydis]